jgi:hypothetical protein
LLRDERLGEMLLVPQKNQISAAMNPELGQHVRDMEFDGALGDFHFGCDFFVGQIVEQEIEHLDFPRTQSRGPAWAFSSVAGAKNRVHKTR